MTLNTIKLNSKVMIETNTEPNHILIIYTGNWADEIDVSGLNITTKEEWELIKKAVKEYFNKKDSEGELVHYELIHDIGTNEGITYDSYESWLYDYEVLPIPSLEVATFIRTLIKSSFKNHFFYPEWDEDIN